MGAETKQKSIYQATGIIASGTFLSRILGLVREQVIAYFFGASLFTDAFQIAFRIPNLLRDLFAEGAMSSALVPVYTRARTEKGEEYAWKSVSNVMLWLALVMGAIALVGIFAADPLVSIYAPAFKQIPGKHELTVSMTQVMWPFLPLVVMAAVCMGILNARDRYGIPALSPSIFNVASILATIFLCPLMPRFGLEPIYGLAIGVLLGGLGQWLVQLPALWKEGFRFHWQLRFRDPELSKMMLLMGAGTLGLGATQINIWINSVMASGQGDGAVSWLNYAFRLMQFPIGVFGVAISTATLARISKQVAENNFESVRASVLSSLRMVLVLTIPSSIGLAVLGYPIISVIYERGRFHAGDTYSTAMALACYSIGLSAYSGIKVLAPIFYSLGRARIAIISSVFSVLVNVVACLVFVHWWSFRGLALATSCAALANCGTLLFMLHFYVKGINFRALSRCFASTALASAVMAAVLFLWLKIAGITLFFPVYEQSLWFQSGFFLRLSFLCLALGLGVVTYMTCAKALGLQEIHDFWGLLKKRLLRS